MAVRKLFSVALLTLGLVAPAFAANQPDQADCAHGDPDKGIAACTRLIEAHPKSTQDLAAVFVKRGDAYQAKGNYELAIADYDSAIRLAPKYKDAYVNRGNTWQSKGEYDKAVADETEAIRLDAKYKSAYVNRGNAWLSKGEYDKAIADFDEAIRLDPKDTIAYFDRGNAHRSNGKYEEAVADFNEAIRLAPKSSGAFFYRGISNLYAGALPKALADLTQANALDPKDAYAALWLDIVTRRSNLPSPLPKLVANLDMTKWPAPVLRLYLGKLKQAAVLTAAYDLNADTKKGQVCEANFYSGELALQQGAKDDAVRLFRFAAADCPKTFNEWFAANAELKALGKSL